MKIIQGIQSFTEKEETILTLGMFDGVHLGHQTIIRQLNQIAVENNAKSGLLTFSPHPRFVLQKDTDLKLLTLLDEKESLLNELNLDYLIVQPFDFEFSRLSSLDFVRDYLIQKLNVKVLLIGHDHHFGRNREGNFERLTELSELYGFKVIKLSAVLENKKPISSTKIRNALLNRDIDYANQALGYQYFLNGTVVHGDKIGRKLGFPTINLDVVDKKLIPADGVYGVKATFDHQNYFGLMSIGNRASFAGEDRRIEVYLLNFNGNLYKKNIRIEVLTYIRNQKKFNSKTELITVIQQDKKSFEHWIQEKNLV